MILYGLFLSSYLRIYIYVKIYFWYLGNSSNNLDHSYTFRCSSIPVYMLYQNLCTTKNKNTKRRANLGHPGTV